jgi:hypothetical protein
LFCISSIIVERWLPYKQQKRRVIYQKAPPVQPPAPQKNLIIQWEGTQARVVKEFRNLGIIKADPGSYVQQYGSQLRPTQGLPDFIRGLPPPNLGPEYVRVLTIFAEKKEVIFFRTPLLILIKSIRLYWLVQLVL